MNIKLEDLSTSVLKTMGGFSLSRAEQIKNDCKEAGVNITQYLIFSEKPNGEQDNREAPTPNLGLLQEHIKGNKASVGTAILVGGLCEALDQCSTIRRELETRLKGDK